MPILISRTRPQPLRGRKCRIHEISSESFDFKLWRIAYSFTFDIKTTHATVLKAKQILDYCLSSLNGTVLVESWGEKGIFYNPGLVLKRGVYVLTVKEKDGDNDKASNLDRTGIYRVNLGLRKSTFQKMYGKIPARPAAGGVVDMDCDFTALDIIIPHPVYAWMGWVSVLNPSKQTFERLKPLIQEAYEFSVEKFKKRK